MREFNSIYPGLVVNNKDPLQQGRVQIRVPQVYGNNISQNVLNVNYIPDAELPWADCSFPFVSNSSGCYLVPPINSGVWVMFVQGDPKYPVCLGSYSSVQDFVSEFKKGHDVDGTPATFILQTPAQHKLIFSDVKSNSYIRLEDSLLQKITLSSRDIAINIETPKGALKSTALNTLIDTLNNHSLSVGKNLNVLIGGMTSISLLGLLMSSPSMATISFATAITLASAKVVLGNEVTKQKLVNALFLQLFNTHTHLSSPVGTPTSPPAIPAVETIHTTTETEAS